MEVVHGFRQIFNLSLRHASSFRPAIAFTFNKSSGVFSLVAWHLVLTQARCHANRCFNPLAGQNLEFFWGIDFTAELVAGYEVNPFAQ